MKKLGYRILTKTEVDVAIEQILRECESMDCYEDIKKSLHNALYNKLYIAQRTDTWKSRKVYRVTPEYDGFVKYNQNAFSFKTKPTENGRAHIIGKPVFYCSLSPNTALLEMKDDFSKPITYYVSEWELESPGNLLCHPLIYTTKTLTDKLGIGDIVTQQIDKIMTHDGFEELTEEEKDNIKHYLLKIGDMFTMKGSTKYNITSTYAHGVLYDMGSEVPNISFLMYPSVTSELTGINLAVHPDVLKQGFMRLKCVLKLNVKYMNNDGIEALIQEVGQPNSKGLIDWFHPSIKDVEIVGEPLQVLTDNGCVLFGNDTLSIPLSGKNETINDILMNAFNNNSNLLPKHRLNTKGTFNPFPLKDTSKDYVVNLEVNPKQSINTPLGLSAITRIKVTYRYTETFKKVIR